MGRVSESYNEAELCPRVMTPAWWFSLPSQTRTRIKAETELPVSSQVVFIGEVQDALIAKGLSRLMGTYMRAMQACYDQETEEMAEALRSPQNLIGEVSTIPPAGMSSVAAEVPETLTSYELPPGATLQPTFGFHEPQIRTVNKAPTGLPPTDSPA